MIVALATQTVVILALLAVLVVRERGAAAGVDKTWALFCDREREHTAELRAREDAFAVERAEIANRHAADMVVAADRHDATVQELLTRIQRPDVLLPPQRLVEAPQEQQDVERDEFDQVGMIIRNIPDED